MPFNVTQVPKVPTSVSHFVLRLQWLDWVVVPFYSSTLTVVWLRWKIGPHKSSTLFWVSGESKAAGFHLYCLGVDWKERKVARLPNGLNHCLTTYQQMFWIKLIWTNKISAPPIFSNFSVVLFLLETLTLSDFFPPTPKKDNRQLLFIIFLFAIIKNSLSSVPRKKFSATNSKTLNSIDLKGWGHIGRKYYSSKMGNLLAEDDWPKRLLEFYE